MFMGKYLLKDIMREDTMTALRDADPVNHPEHYNTGEIEVFDFIKDKLTPEELRGYIKSNVLKYISRERHKGGDEDLRKAKWYLDRLCERLEE